MKINEFSSFRDPAGNIFYENNKVYRKINKEYIENYNKLMKSGLYKELVDNNLMISHKEIKVTKNYIILEVERIPFISYPYEWSFDMLKDASLLTLRINKIALKYNMILKDASAYNITYYNGRPIFMDTLSFIEYERNSPWGAYGQFTRHFIAPLLLMSKVNVKLNNLLVNYVDGIPVDLCTNILNGRGGITSYLHIKMQDKMLKKHNKDNRKDNRNISINRNGIINMLEMMERELLRLNIKKTQSEWQNYYENTNYSYESMTDKNNIIFKFLKKITIKSNDNIVDLGGNDGRLTSYLCEKNDINLIILDIDANSINRSYLLNKNNNYNIIPLVQDLSNTSPSIGFMNKERKGIIDRIDAKVVFSLALMHHLVISNNLSFEMLSLFFSEIGKYLVIEYIPKDDSKAQLLLKNVDSSFSFYTEENFIKAFKKLFNIIDKVKIKDSKRVLYLMEKKENE